MKFYLLVLLIGVSVHVLQVTCEGSVLIYNTSTPVSAADSVSFCIDSSAAFRIIIFQTAAASVITQRLCDIVLLDTSDEPDDIVAFCVNSSNMNTIYPFDVRVVELTQNSTTFNVYAIVRFPQLLGSPQYVVNNDIVSSSITDSRSLALLPIMCGPLNGTNTTLSDEYDASSLSGMSIFASIVLILEVIIVGIFSITWLEYGLGHLSTPTTVQQVTEVIEETVTGL